jgi:murein DD-endopeptidase MepM/ murein hydrolase activator NlpD
MTEARFVMDPSQQDPPAPLSRRALRDAERAREQAGQQLPGVPQPSPFQATSAPHIGYQQSDFTTASGRDFSKPSKRVTVVVRQPPKQRKRIASRLFSLGALLFAGAMVVGMSIPANAFMTDDVVDESTPSLLANAQSVVVPLDALSGEADRAGFTVTSYAEMLRKKYGNRSFSYSVGEGPIQWPFPYSVPVTSGFGERVAPCRGCSTFHNGVDFVPGAGVPIYSIAAGTVIEHEDNDRNSFGNHVLIEHVINGKKVQSLYAHMKLATSPLNVGDVVEVGEFIGLVGSTGSATAPHLHLEVHLAGVPVDPFSWLKAHAAK